MHALDHRLHLLGSALFVTTALLGMTLLIGNLASIGAILDRSKILSVLTAALPTLGSAVFGIRGAGDFAGASTRSARTAVRLQTLIARLGREPLTLPSAARVIEEATATMTRELGEWRATYQNRVLAIPA
jgi:hypothetical protein